MFSVDKFGEQFSGMTRLVVVVSVQTGFFLRPLLSTSSRKHVLLVVKVPVLVLIKASLHDDRFQQAKRI